MTRAVGASHNLWFYIKCHIPRTRRWGALCWIVLARVDTKQSIQSTESQSCVSGATVQKPARGCATPGVGRCAIHCTGYSHRKRHTAQGPALVFHDLLGTITTSCMPPHGQELLYLWPRRRIRCCLHGWLHGIHVTVLAHLNRCVLWCCVDHVCRRAGPQLSRPVVAARSSDPLAALVPDARKPPSRRPEVQCSSPLFRHPHLLVFGFSSFGCCSVFVA